MRWAGVGWPNGPEPGRIYDLPGSTFLLLDSESRWHLDQLRVHCPDALIVERSVGAPPEVFGWDAESYVLSLLVHWGEQQSHTDLIAGNEFNLNYERGQGWDDDWDWDTMARVYREVPKFLSKVRGILRQRVPGVRLHFPAWTPGHYLHDFTELWADEARQWGAVDVHAYGTAEEIGAEIDRFRALFPDKPLLLSEWNSGDNVPVEERDDNERAVLLSLAQRCDQDPLFLGACYFIWRWWPDSRPQEWNIEGNVAREALFFDPPKGDEDPKGC